MRWQGFVMVSKALYGLACCIGMASYAQEPAGYRVDTQEQGDATGTVVVSWPVGAVVVRGEVRVQGVAHQVFRRYDGRAEGGGFVVQDFYAPSDVGKGSAQENLASKLSDPFVVLREEDVSVLSRSAVAIEGPLMLWHPDGSRWVECHFQSGKLDGAWAQWFANGVLMESGTYAQGVLQGGWTGWYANGSKQVELSYTNGRPDGHWTEWYDNGQKSDEGEYLNGEREGVWTRWHPNGKLAAQGTYRGGEPVAGSWREWDETGKPVTATPEGAQVDVAQDEAARPDAAVVTDETPAQAVNGTEAEMKDAPAMSPPVLHGW